MGLFDKKTNKEERKGNIPERLGIKQERANEIIKAVISSYAEHTGNASNVFEDIFEEKLEKSEHSFACYALGCIKTDTEREFRNDSLNGIEDMIELLEKAIRKE